MLNGDAVRVTVRVRSLVPAGAELAANVVVPTGTGLTPVSLGRLPARGTVTLTGQLAGCPCTLHDLNINLAVGQAVPAIAGNLVFTRLQVHRGTGWAAAGLQKNHDPCVGPGRGSHTCCPGHVPFATHFDPSHSSWSFWPCPAHASMHRTGSSDAAGSSW